MKRISFTATILFEMEDTSFTDTLIEDGNFICEWVEGTPPLLFIREHGAKVVKPSGGHVYDQAKDDEGYKPGQTGGVITAEPENIARARAMGEQLPEGGGDMVT